MSESVAIVDYGAGNILNVARAFHAEGIEAEIVEDARELDKFSHVVLPGVGSFRFGMERLNERGLSDEIRRLFSVGRPILGICLGMQLCAEKGLEHGSIDGLGLLTGTIEDLGSLGQPRDATRIPHTGWSDVNWRDPVDSWLERPSEMLTTAYFNHSFFLSGSKEQDVVASAGFGDRFIPVAASSGSLFATQFHPEKSGKAGLLVLGDWFKGRTSSRSRSTKKI
jgi:imidazole glycerol-phosphate synthase subunit HisH